MVIILATISIYDPFMGSRSSNRSTEFSILSPNQYASESCAASGNDYYGSMSSSRLWALLYSTSESRTKSRCIFSSGGFR